MSPSHRYLQPFLAACCSRLAAPAAPVVLGNESADLDSIISALLYSYLHPAHPTPLLSIPSSDLSLRPELLHLLRHPRLSLPPSSLLFAPDHDLRSRPIHLVDHNSPTLQIPDPEIVGIIDHHDDEHRFPSASPRLIQKAGSCTSLVLHHFSGAGAVNALKDEEKRELAVLAMAAVLVDTANLTMRVTRYDEAAVDMLESWLSGDATEKWDREKFYQDVVTAKRSVDSLTLRDLLRKDYKEWEEAGKMLGVASVVKGLSWILAREGKEGFLKGLEEWGKERRLDVVVVMTTEGDGDEFRRELMVWGLTDGGAEVVKHLEDRADGAGLGLQGWEQGELDSGAHTRRRAWRQRNVEMSRKQVAPFIRECMKAGTKAKV